MVQMSAWANTGERFKGGFKRFAKAPMQVSDNVREEGSKAKFLPFGVTGGLLKGCFYMMKELVGGTMDMATAPVNREDHS